MKAPVKRANIIGGRLRQARTGAGLKRPSLTQEELARRLPPELGLTRHSIAKIEAGSRAAKDYEVAALADALGIDVRWLLEAAEAREP